MPDRGGVGDGDWRDLLEAAAFLGHFDGVAPAGAPVIPAAVIDTVTEALRVRCAAGEFAGIAHQEPGPPYLSGSGAYSADGQFTVGWQGYYDKGRWQFDFAALESYKAGGGS